MANWIETAITKYTGATDAADVAGIMDIMADHVRTFSSLSPAKFRQTALDAQKTWEYLNTDHGKASWGALCMSYGIDISPCAS